MGKICVILREMEEYLSLMDSVDGESRHWYMVYVRRWYRSMEEGNRWER